MNSAALVKDSRSTQGHNWNQSVVADAKQKVAFECSEKDGKSLNANTHSFSMLRRLCKVKHHNIHGCLTDIARRHKLTDKRVLNISERVLVEYANTSILKVPALFDKEQYRKKKQAAKAKTKPPSAYERGDKALAIAEIKNRFGHITHVDQQTNRLATNEANVISERNDMNSTRHTVLANGKLSDKRNYMDRDDAHKYLLRHLGGGTVKS